MRYNNTCCRDVVIYRSILLFCREQLIKLGDEPLPMPRTFLGMLTYNVLNVAPITSDSIPYLR